VYRALAAGVFLLHLLFILWVIFGAAFTRRHPLLRWLHIGSLVWGLLIEILPWTCPLTFAEDWCLQRAGIAPYQGGFLLHYLDAVVYPDIPPWILIVGAVIVVLTNAIVYARRVRESSF
jgi:4-hydroxybenzoate polyprenyltransferase